MPTPLSSFPTAYAPSPSADKPAFTDDRPAGDANASFDTVLSRTAPAGAQNAARNGKSSPGSEAKSSDSKTAGKPVQDSDTDAKAADAKQLTAEQLAALLALMGAPAPVPPPPAPDVSLDLSAEIPTESVATDKVAVEPLSTGKEIAASPESFALPGDRATDVSGAESPAADAVPSTHELLAQGTETIDFQLTEPASVELPAYFKPVAPAPAPSPVASSPVEAANSAANVSAPASTPDVAQAASVSSSTTPPPVVSDRVAAALQAAQSATSPTPSPAQKSTGKPTAEKNAGSGVFASSETKPGVKSSLSVSQNKFLNADSEEVEEPARVVGTSAANWGVSMKSASHNPLDLGASSSGSVLATALRGDTTTSSHAPAATPAPHAAQIVREIRDIADGLWAVERNSVEVRFNFSDTERLSVRVEYKNGVVQTTFRTDSPELRDTITREWQSQIASSEARPYRVADPVFNTPPADARGFSLGGDPSRQQQRQAEQSAAPATFAASFGRGPAAGSSLSAPAASPVFTRPDTALHLHAFA